MEEATKMDSAEMTPVIENIVPSVPSERPNFRLKKYVTQDLRLSAKASSLLSGQTYKGAKPDARLSKANRMHSCTSTTRLSLLISGKSLHRCVLVSSWFCAADA